MNKKEFFYLSLTIFLTIVAWVIFEIYKVDLAIKKEKENPIINKRIDLDFSIINELKTKKTYDLQ